MEKSKETTSEKKKTSKDSEKGDKDKILVYYGIIYSISILLILLIMISFLFISDTNYEGIKEDESAKVIKQSDYPGFFNDDLFHFPNGSTEVVIERCLACHKSQGDEIIFKSEQITLYNSSKKEMFEKCTTCHFEPKHKIREPYDLCTQCHYLNGHNPLSLTFNYYMEKTGSLENDFCQECHTKQCSELEKVSHTHEEVCTSCHNDHKKIPGCLDCHDATFVGPYHELDSPEFQICTDCHKGGAHTRPIINDDMDCSLCHTESYMNTLQTYGGEHFSNPTLGKCSSCHKAHKEYPSCRDCHGMFPEHLNNASVKDPNEKCTICHEGGAHDVRVNYQNYDPELGDKICEVCHQEEYRVYYQTATPEEIERYGNCLNCHKEHNTDINVPHNTSGNIVYCNKCHIGYAGPKTMHIISDTSYRYFPYNNIPNEFCANCHKNEYEVLKTNLTPQLSKFYDSCTDCHNDHKKVDNKHKIEAPYDDCDNCHTTYNEKITIHNPTNITYSSFSPEIDNDFCSNCHNSEYEQLSEMAHSEESCTSCHSEHNTISVNFDNCKACHDKIPVTHSSISTGCGQCHNLVIIHSKDT